MSRFISSLLFLLVCDLVHLDITPVAAISFPVRGHVHPPSRRRSLSKRATNTSVHVNDVSNTEYLADITMGGQQLVVTIDTGSSDLWIAQSIPGTSLTNTNVSVNYAVGSVFGPVGFVETTFSGFTVPSQAFIAAQDDSERAKELTSGNGLIGLGPSQGSIIRSTINDAKADPFLDNVFRQNTSTPNFITVLLQRTGDHDATVNGQFTISETIPGMDSIQSQNQVPVAITSNTESANQHWTTLIDAVYGPDGNIIPVDSTVPGTPDGKFVAAYDTGFTLPQVPSPISDAIYGRVQGAEFDENQSVWIIPCDQELNVTFTIGGQNLTINPLDTSPPATTVGGQDPNQCIGAFQPIDFNSGNTIDAILGMSFIRNAYLLINFGDFVDGNPNNQKDPFMQFLSTTTPQNAHQDFVDTRLNGNDITGEPQFALLPPSQGQRSSQPKVTGVTSSTSPFSESNIHRFLPYIIAGSVILGLAILGLLFTCCCRGRRNRRYYGSANGAIGGGGAGGGGPFVLNPRSYRSLQDPTPAGYSMYNMPPPQPGPYKDPYYG